MLNRQTFAAQQSENRRDSILLIVLVLILIGALPTWPYSSAWGYAPSGILGAIVVVVLILLLLGKI